MEVFIVFIFFLGIFSAIFVFLLGRGVRKTLETTRICPHCGTRIPKQYKVCSSCGRESEPESKPIEVKRGICPNPYCKAKISENEEVCHRCGINLKDKKYRWI